MPPQPCIDPLTIIEEEARAVAQCYGAAWCDEAAAKLIDRLVLRLGGAAVYVPRRGAAERRRVHAAIRERGNGRNIEDLAREFNMTPRNVRKIIAGARERI